ncbi:unnamed protein product [Ambrosiozyma monospora]|uniref:Unnamed protein product n=1 Tax=Ambrosiozyma monospora TaxID=43982 RepID=A0ACB5TKI8_AMBMO|nr:unnamed protein product [Ambrosiozyma monospora]
MEDADNDISLETEHTNSPKDCCKEVQGSLPSRVLPHLYLGSLNHACSLPLLKALGITHIVSVGERVPWVDEVLAKLNTTESGCEVLNIEPNQETLSGDLCQISEVMRISNINDDGVGTLTTTINDALAFIDRCYKAGGKVLVHCQVGVSRSATVCIAEVMKRLNVTLPRAYLFVRVRRLNVIIQPNLKLMYELFKWEESFVKSKIQAYQSAHGTPTTVARYSFSNAPRHSSLSSAQSLVSNGSTLFSYNGSQRSSMSTSFSSASFRDSRNSFNNSKFKCFQRQAINSMADGNNYSSFQNANAVAEEAAIEEDDEDDNIQDNIDDVFINSDSSDTESTQSAAVGPSSNCTSATTPNSSTKFKNISFGPGTTTNTNNNIATQIMMNNQSFPTGTTLEETTVSPKSSIDLGTGNNLPVGINIVSNSKGFLREVDWCILCREIFNLNRAYIKPAA